MTNPYLPLSPQDRAAMLKEIGFDSFEAMIAHIPAAVRAKPIKLPVGQDEQQVQAYMRDLAGRNMPLGPKSFLGAGVYQRFVPAAVDAIVGRSEFYTAYTPYQPEVAQGTLQYTYEYQTMICALTGMDVSNASLYDGSTATPEAAFMAMRVTGRQEVLIASTVHPEYREVLATYAQGHEGMRIRVLEAANGRLAAQAVTAAVSEATACVIVQCPNFFGQLEDMQAIADATHAKGALLVVVADPVSLGVLAAPGSYGADIVIGDGQQLGNGTSFGGPHVGFLACRNQYFRQLPGRVVGASVDTRGQRVYTLTLQTREQHIRREKATSNICTNQALVALAVTVYLSLAGPEGLRAVAEVSAQRAHHLAAEIARIPGFSLAFDGPFLNEFVVKSPVPVAQLLDGLQARGILGGVPLARWYPELGEAFMVAVTEVNTPEALAAMLEGLREVSRQTASAR
jgi:glycine dehydrogenase subunit 1